MSMEKTGQTREQTLLELRDEEAQLMQKMQEHMSGVKTAAPGVETRLMQVRAKIAEMDEETNGQLD